MTDLGPSSLRVVAVAPYVIAEQPPPHRLRQQLAAVPKRSMPLARRLATRRFDILVRSGKSRGSGAMVRRCRSRMRPDQPIPPFDPTPVTVTKPATCYWIISGLN